MPGEKKPENYWQKISSAFIVVFVISALMAFLEFHGAIAGLEGKLQDMIWLQHGSTRGMSSMVILEIDDRTYENFFGSSSPLCPKILTGLVQQIANAGPAVIGVDVLSAADSKQNIRTYQSFADSDSNSKVVWASAGEPANDQAVSFTDWILGKDEIPAIQPTSVLAFDLVALRGKPNVHWGPAIYPTQDDLKLRRFPRQLTLITTPPPDETTETRPTWARLIATRYCALHADLCDLQSLEKGREVFFTFGGPPPLSFSIDEFFELQKQAEHEQSCEGSVAIKASRGELLTRLVKDKIVLVGGTFPQSGDFHATPSGQREAGIVINARAIAAEIRGDNFSDIQQPWSFLLDLLTGLVVVLFMAGLQKWRHWEPRTARAMMLTSAVVAAIIMIALYKSHYLFSPAAVLIATLIQQLYDFWRENPAIPERPEPTNTARSYPLN